MGAEGATGILFAKEMKDPANAALVEQKKAEYKATFMTPTIAAQRDYISEVINPEDTRKYVLHSFALLENKTSSDAICKKHGNIPL